MRHLTTLLLVLASTLTTQLATMAQPQAATAEDVRATLCTVNDYFMSKWEDPTVPTYVNKLRPS